MDKKKIGVWEILVCVLAFAVLFAACCWIIPFLTVAIFPGSSWSDYRPCDWVIYESAVNRFIRGDNPYNLPGRHQFHNPPWILLVYLPFTLLPYPFGSALFMVVGFVVYLYIYSRYNSSLLSAAFYLLSAPVVWGLLGGQISWIILIGLLLPPQYGLFLILAKPQMGCLVALIWFIEAYRERRIIRTFLPVTVAFGLSFVFYGFWPLNWVTLVETEPMWWWPYSLILGIPLLWHTLKKQEVCLALCTSPLLSPHTCLHSWCGGMLIVSHPVTMALVSIGTWVYLYIYELQTLVR